jgi:aspartate/methionine/tyrosine aminotransferase
MRLSQRMARLGTETAFEVLVRARALEAKGRDVIHLEIGEPDFDTPAHISEAAVEALRAGATHYGPAAGMPELREAIAEDSTRRRGVRATPEMVVVTPGAKPIMFFVILALVDDGDEVLYPNPGFPIYESMIRYIGGNPVPVRLLEEKGFTLDVDQLVDRVGPRTRLIILNYPHNPTGGLLSKAELTEIAAVLRRHPQVWVYADEIYSRLAYTGEFFSIAQVPGMYERTILSDGASKTWAMTGWRIGFTSNPALAPVFTRWITNTDSCASQISQWAAVEAINGPQDAAEAMKRSFLERRDLIVRLLNEVPGVKCLTPGGAFYVWPNVTEACRMIGAADSEEFRKRLLNEAGVALLADIHFGARVPGEGQHVRFSYAASKEAIEKGVARMADFIRKNTKKAA